MSLTLGELNEHVATKHKVIWFDCDQCVYQGTDKNKLEVHKKNAHEAKVPMSKLMVLVEAKWKEFTCLRKKTHEAKVYACFGFGHLV